MDLNPKDRYKIDDLLAIMERLRAPGGCPWDREQTHQSIRSCFLEETYEAVEAIDNDDAFLLREELGDVLLQVVFHAQIEKEAGRFDFSDVVDEVSKKMVERHPHVFGDVTVRDSSEVLTNWDAIKKRTKKQETQSDVLRSVSRALPALMRSAKVQQKAEKSGYKPLDPAQEELRCMVTGGSSQESEEKIGDLLFSLVSVSRALFVDPEQALERACDRFIDRFQAMEKQEKEQEVDSRL